MASLMRSHIKITLCDWIPSAEHILISSIYDLDFLNAITFLFVSLICTKIGGRNTKMNGCY